MTIKKLLDTLYETLQLLIVLRKDYFRNDMVWTIDHQKVCEAEKQFDSCMNRSAVARYVVGSAKHG